MILIVCVLLFVNSICCQSIYNDGDNGATGNKKCAALGEYCQYQWDCCSNNCLTFSYKCIKSRQQIQPAAVQPEAENEFNAASTANNIDELVDRFGGNDDDNDDRKTTKRPTNIIDSGTVYPGNNLGRCLVAGEWCQSSAQCCTSLCSSYYGVCINQLSESRSCMGYRETCSSHLECCSRACFYGTCGVPHSHTIYGVNQRFPPI